MRYQRRGARDDWLLRHLVAWQPLPGGSVELQANLSDFRDTRDDMQQRSAGLAVVFRPRSRLMFEGGVEKTRYERGDQVNWPLSSRFRGNWTF